MGQSDPNMTPVREGRPDSTDNTVLTFTVTLALCWELNIPKLHCTAATQVSLSKIFLQPSHALFPLEFALELGPKTGSGTPQSGTEFHWARWMRYHLAEGPAWREVPTCIFTKSFASSSCPMESHH